MGKKDFEIMESNKPAVSEVIRALGALDAVWPAVVPTAFKAKPICIALSMDRYMNLEKALKFAAILRDFDAAVAALDCECDADA